MRTPRKPVRRAAIAFALLLAGAAPSAQEQAGQEPQRPIVKGILVEGNERYTDAQLISPLGQRIGAPLDADAVTRGLKILFRTFHVHATVEFHQLGPSAEDGVELKLRVRELALDLEPRFIGNVEIDSEKLLEWAGLEDESELYLYEAPRVKTRLTNRYLEEGFYFIEISVVDRPGGIDPETGDRIAPDVIFEIKEGPEVKVRKLVINGSETFPDRGFWPFKRGISKLSQIELRKPLLFNWFAKDFVEDTLNADIIAIRNVYRDYGYLDAVVEVERLEFTDDREWVTIHIIIDQGGRYTVGSLSIEAVERVEDQNLPGGFGERPANLAFPEDELIALLKVKVGEVYERRQQKEDERALRAHYGREGYIDHRSLRPWDRWRFLDPALVFERDSPVVHVVYRIAQGQQIYIRGIPISGNLHTQDRVVRRQITVEPGQRADFEEIERSRRLIRGTGFFSDTRDPTHIDPDYRFLDTDDSSWKDLEFLVEEGNVLTFNVSGGVSSNTGLFGTISLRQNNFDATNLPRGPTTLIEDVATRQAFHGAGQSLSINASPGTELSQFSIRFTEPDIFRRHKDRISLSLSALRRERIFEDYDEDRSEIGFSLGRVITPEASVFTGYTFGSVDVDDVDTDDEPSLGDPLSVPRDLADQEGKNDLNFVTAGARYRDVDQPQFPRNGIEIYFRTRFYDDAWGSDFNFVKSELNFDFWDEFDEDPDVVSSRYHLGFKSGVAIDYGSTDSVPYTERFYLGGLSTLRGFEFRGVGPNEKGSPIGGQTMLFGTAEYRQPLVKQIQPGSYREVEMVQAGVFFDIGVLDPDEFEVDPDEIRMSAGILFGITVPIPITFSFGWPLKEDDGDDKRVVGFRFEL